MYMFDQARIVLNWCLICCVIIAHCNPDLENNDGSLNAAERGILLDYVNAFRKAVAKGHITGYNGQQLPAASNMNALFWDPCLASVAHDWASKCDYDYDKNRVDNVNACTDPEPTFELPVPPAAPVTIGPNIYASTNKAKRIGDLLAGMDSWIDDVQSYQYGQYCEGHECTATLIKEPQTCDIANCASATQMFWVDTRYIGCGYAFCKTGITNFGNDGRLMMVCNFYKAGNQPLAYPYPKEDTNVDCQLSVCDSDRPFCNGNLCGGGMRSDWYTTTQPSEAPDDCSDGTGENPIIDRDVGGCSPTPEPTPQPTPLPTDPH